MARKHTHTFQSGTKTFFFPMVLSAWSLLFVTSSSLGIDYSATLRVECNASGYTLGAEVTFVVPNPYADLCVCVCENTSNGSCAANGCSLATPGCSSTLTRVTLMQQASAGCSGSGSVSSRILCEPCSNPLILTDESLSPAEQCAMANGEMQIFVESGSGDFLWDVEWAKPPEEPVIPIFCSGVPATSDWGLASLVLLTLIAGSVAIRQRAC